MRQLKIYVCLTFVIAAAGFELYKTTEVAGQSGGSPLAAPTNLIASDNTYNNKVGLYWDTIRGAAFYRIFRNATNNPLSADDIGTTASNSFFDTGASPTQIFFYWVRAENGSAVSDFSVADQGMLSGTFQRGPVPPLDPPPAPPANPVTATKAYLG